MHHNLPATAGRQAGIPHASQEHMHILQATARRQPSTSAPHQHKQHVLQATTGTRTPAPTGPSAQAARPAGNSRQTDTHPCAPVSTCSASCRQQQAGRHEAPAAQQHMQRVLQATAGTQTPGPARVSAHAACRAGNSMQADTKPLQPNSTCSASCRQQQAGRHQAHASHQHTRVLQATAGRQANTPPCIPQAHATRPRPCKVHL